MTQVTMRIVKNRVYRSHNLKFVLKEMPAGNHLYRRVITTKFKNNIRGKFHHFFIHMIRLL
jgi:hypothetical protein